LADGTNTYLYGNGRIAQTSSTTEYFLGDALGSVRQLVNSAGAVTLTQSYAPYGETVSSVGSGTSAYQYTGESRDANGLTYLRARYLDSSTGRFTQRDPSGLEANLYLYAGANPVNRIDPAGLQSYKVECHKISESLEVTYNLRTLCNIANGNLHYPIDRIAVLDAREKFFRNISKMSKLLGAGGVNEGYWWAGQMLEYYVDGATSVNVNLPENTSFGKDAGIRRALIDKRPPRYSKDEEPAKITPLLHVFLKEYVQPQVGCENYQILFPKRILGAGNYFPQDISPRPYARGWWGAFGHVIVDATYSNIVVQRNADNSGYIIDTKVNYKVEDDYGWYPEDNKTTPLPLGIGWSGMKFIDVPHAWEQSLADAGMAFEYPFTIAWSNHLQINVPNDFSMFWINSVFYSLQ